jgi:hypothetical protein
LARGRETLDAPSPTLAAAFGSSPAASGPDHRRLWATWEKSTLSPGERRLSSRQRTALVKNVSSMREEQGADPRPACLAAVGRTGGQLHAVLVKHRPRHLHA